MPNVPAVSSASSHQSYLQDERAPATRLSRAVHRSQMLNLGGEAASCHDSAHSKQAPPCWSSNAAAALWHRAACCA